MNTIQRGIAHILGIETRQQDLYGCTYTGSGQSGRDSQRRRAEHGGGASMLYAHCTGAFHCGDYAGAPSRYAVFALPRGH